jgi:hypothetical protein
MTDTDTKIPTADQINQATSPEASAPHVHCSVDGCSFNAPADKRVVRKWEKPDADGERRDISAFWVHGEELDNLGRRPGDAEVRKLSVCVFHMRSWQRRAIKNGLGRQQFLSLPRALEIAERKRAKAKRRAKKRSDAALDDRMNRAAAKKGKGGKPEQRPGKGKGKGDNKKSAAPKKAEPKPEPPRIEQVLEQAETVEEKVRENAGNILEAVGKLGNRPSA